MSLATFPSSIYVSVSTVMALVCLAPVASAQDSGATTEFKEVSPVHTGIHQTTHDSPWVRWGLSKPEWVEYQKIMKSPRGAFSPQMSPIQALGLTTGSESKRVRYAMLQAKLIRKFNIQDVQWQTAVNEASEEVDAGSHAEFQTTGRDAIQTDDHWASHSADVYLFVDSACTLQCLALIDKAVNRTAAATHIFVAGATTEDELRRWGTTMQIPVEVVRQGNVTLNFYGNQLEDIGLKDPEHRELPVAVVKDGGGYVELPLR